MPTAANVGLRPLSLGAPAQGRIDADGEEARPVVGGLHRHLRDRLPAAVRTRENVCAALSASLTERTAEGAHRLRTPRGCRAASSRAEHDERGGEQATSS